MQYMQTRLCSSPSAPPAARPMDRRGGRPQAYEAAEAVRASERARLAAGGPGGGRRAV
jgi:hypothetical protein